ncbi:prepilin-type N-terminal cleavage/methylation domain-containing protein [Deinobacterium chartae]|uniref:Prepilin-type N-terminal cleavage/methylation domain-containing protein n=1 Tax=Deinobacterium chartae TaxID=521158 RepID=A0A841HXI7_9DEIO|nr:prepilin-type N-terminal cleavage/methylation domain-containing protein [Deinobacterium chartae]MBB6096910.1 prepilin-type N-terminal cleavage/methylation domain-containing protein [Deinobacterium chartae]
MKRAGVTLVELLVALGVLGILLVAAGRYFASSTDLSFAARARAEVLSELQTAQAIIAARARQAAFVYPEFAELTLSNSGYTTRNPLTDGYVWKISDGLMLAMILPPENRAQPCGGGNTSGCFMFYAYYPVKRSALMKAAPLLRPVDDPLNQGSWVLMEYRAAYDSPPGYERGAPLPPVPTGQQGRMLAEYLSPVGAPGYPRLFLTEGEHRPDDEGNPALQPDGNPNTWVFRVHSWLSGERSLGAQTARVPRQGALEQDIFVRNTLLR